MGTKDRTSGSKCILLEFGKKGQGPTFRVCFQYMYSVQVDTSKPACPFQNGACPVKNDENQHHPFTAAAVYGPTVAKLHFMFGNLSRLDARKNTESKKPWCNWFCRDHDYIKNPMCLALYGPLYFRMFYEVMKGWAFAGKFFTSVKNDGEIDDLMEQQMTM